MAIVRDVHDEMEGEKVAFQARKVGTIKVVHATGAHNTNRGSLEREVYCVIEKPTRLKN
jgi:hypothetical protein